MPNNSIPGQIISEIGQVAKDIGSQAAQVPKDIAGKAMESLGASTSAGKQAVTTGTTASQANKEPTAWEQIDVAQSAAAKRAIARKALEELVGGGVARKKEPSIWEKLMAEQEQKKQQSQQQAAASAQSLPQTGSKRPAGDLYGAKAKKTATENRNVRQD